MYFASKTVCTNTLASVRRDLRGEAVVRQHPPPPGARNTLASSRRDLRGEVDFLDRSPRGQEHLGQRQVGPMGVRLPLST